MQILIKTCLMPLALKTQNDSFTFVHELKQEMHADLKYVESLEDEIDELESDKAEFSNMYDMLLQECVSNDVMCSYLRSLSDLDAHTELQCLYLHKVKEFCKEKASNVFQKEREQYFEIQDLKAQLQDKNIAIRVTHRTNVSRPHLRSNQIKDKVVPNNSQVKNKKTEVEDHPRIPSISNKTKSVTACNDSLKSRTLIVNDVCATCGKCLVDSNHFACVTKILNDVHARTKKHNVVPVSSRKPKSQMNKSVATPPRKTVASETTIQKSKSYYLQGNDLLTSNRGSDLYTISLQDTTSSNPLCLMAKASPTQVWLWHRRLSHLNFDYINLLSKKDVMIGLPKLKYVKDQLCSSCEVSKAKRSSFKTKVVPNDYSRYTWTLFLRSKDETPEVLKDFLTMIQRNLQALVISVRTDRGTEFLNKTLHAFFKEEGIEHQTSTPRTPKQNGVVERRNHTLVEAARTMLSASKLPLFFWAEAIATACYTQNRSIIIPTHEKTAYHIINDRKPSIKHLHIFGCTCYLTRDGENLVNEKKKGIRAYPWMDTPLKQRDYDNSVPDPQLQNVSPSADTTVPSQQELDLLFGPLYDEFFNAGTSRVNKSSSPTDNSA
ncbi:retrovirus-related pol polyprotein from transposon TNT 1-94 [Tanacetum coccineum]|uniref:Retrovirus-related pol polyprotein from transposon TNT 1-94 n=1 Tax=Tanacetum coccineum TaxID=301880 RepID=A0ABQ5HT42_9ASTR